MELRNYICYILRNDNTHDIRTIEPSAKLSAFIHAGQKYEFDPRASFIIREPTTVWYWLTPKRFLKYDRLLLYREEMYWCANTIKPLSVPVTTNAIEESPSILRGITRSPLLRNYRRKQKFGNTALTWQFFAVLGVIAVAILLIMTGKVQL